MQDIWSHQDHVSNSFPIFSLEHDLATNITCILTKFIYPNYPKEIRDYARDTMGKISNL